MSPLENKILERLGYRDQANQVEGYYKAIVPSVLKILERATGRPFPGRAVSGETPYCFASRKWITPELWPVKNLVAAMLGQPLTVGTMAALHAGTADIAVDPSGRRLWLAVAPPAAGYGPLEISYDTGLADEMPDDLLEVAIELSILIGNEKDRAGFESQNVGEMQIKYTRELPLWARQALEANRRVDGWI